MTSHPTAGDDVTGSWSKEPSLLARVRLEGTGRVRTEVGPPSMSIHWSPRWVPRRDLFTMEPVRREEMY